MPQCLISLGSNLGDRRERLQVAACRIADCVDATGFATSRLFETPPIGGPGGQEPFLNAVAALETRLPAAKILHQLQTIEHDLGRVRQTRWSARSIDLDVVLHGDLIGGSSRLVVPHPRYTARTFVLTPALDVAAHYRDPRFGWTLERLSRHIAIGPPSITLSGGTDAFRRRLVQAVADRHGIATTPRVDAPWITAAPPADLASAPPDDPCRPRLIARVEAVDADHRWPTPHRMFPAGGNFPEYGLEWEDFDWAVGELAATLQSMRCAVQPVSDDGLWWTCRP